MNELAARTNLEAYLDRNRTAIHALRSLAQRRVADTNLRYDAAVEEQLTAAIDEHSGGQLDPWDGSICGISDNTCMLNGYEGDWRSINQDPQSVRGFFFRVLHRGTYYECVDLDAGRSRQFFDQKSAQEQIQFAQRFAERIKSHSEPRDFSTRLTSPVGYVAFLTDLADRYQVDQFAPFRIPIMSQVPNFTLNKVRNAVGNLVS